MGMLTTMIFACQPHSVSYASYDEYPVYEGKWEEMTYTPLHTSFCLVGTYRPTSKSASV